MARILVCCYHFHIVIQPPTFCLEPLGQAFDAGAASRQDQIRQQHRLHVRITAHDSVAWQRGKEVRESDQTREQIRILRENNTPNLTMQKSSYQQFSAHSPSTPGLNWANSRTER